MDEAWYIAKTFAMLFGAAVIFVCVVGAIQ